MFEPGKSGNPKGRPKKGFAIADRLEKIGNERVGDKGLQKIDVVLRQAYADAMKGNAAARDFIANRMEGKALERIIQKNTEDDIEIL